MCKSATITMSFLVNITRYHPLFSCSTAKWDSRWSRLNSQEFWSRHLFRAPFLAPSSCYGGEQCDPKKVCSVAQFSCRIPHTASLLRKATIQNQAACVQVRNYSFQYFLTCCFAARPSPQGFCMICIYVLAVNVCCWLRWHALWIGL